MATGCDVSENDVTGSDVTGINVIRGIYTAAASADRWICAVVAAAAAILTE
jgi:hypothetical protein